MDLNDQLGKLKETAVIAAREEKIQNTIQKAKDHYYRQEQNRLLTWWEFLWVQLQYTRKRWWILQGALLLAGSQLVFSMEADFLRVRSVGAIGCLFMVLMIPELWRNRETGATQVEAACLYSLRQIYAARITLFGMVDITLLTLFSLGLGRMGFTWVEVLSQFLLPVTVTACICFSLLCGKSNVCESASLTACLIWGGAWCLVLMNEGIYMVIVPAVWAALFGMTLVFLALAVYRTVHTTNQSWEVAFV